MLGLTFKPETDDMRDAPAATILPALLEKGARLRAHDPKGMEEAKKCLPGGIEYVKNAYEAAEGRGLRRAHDGGTSTGRSTWNG